MSYAGMVGGGPRLSPGGVTLADKGPVSRDGHPRDAAIYAWLVPAHLATVRSMSIAKGQLFEPGVVPSGALSAGMRAVADVLAVSGADTLNMDRTLKDKSREQRAITVAELDGMCDLTERFTIAAHFPGGSTRVLMLFAGRPGFAEVNVTADDASTASAMLKAFTTGAGLHQYTEEAVQSHRPGPELDASADAQPRLPVPSPSEPSRRLTVFLSYRFTATNAGVAATIQGFLIALGIEVITGQGYEPRSVSTKVAGRLSRVDAVVLLVGSDGESPWTRDEVAVAHANGAAVIPLVEQGSAFSPGLFGDLEYIPYEAGHIGDAFLSLAQAVQYIRVMGQAH